MLTSPLRFVSLGLLALLAACHPLSCYGPPVLDAATPLTLSGQDLDDDVDIYVDNMGVPHIFAENETDMMYGLGFMHARQRLFQISVFKYASQGRLCEILGADYLDADRFFRLYIYRLDELLDALSERDIAIIDSYAAGLNAGAEHAGKSAEMNLLSVAYGADFEPFSRRDIVSIMRLQQNGQSGVVIPELIRSYVQSKLKANDSRTAIFTSRTPNGGVPVVSSEDHAGEANFQAQVPVKHRDAFKQEPQNVQELSGPPRKSSEGARTILSPKVQKLLESLYSKGASNSWAVDGAHTEEGVPVLLNDPHLGHGAPGIFYMVHMETPNFMVAGVSFPGLPAVLIGHGKSMAWGITNSYADGQDLARITPYQNRDDMYLLDGLPQNYGRITQSYKLGASDDAEVFEEVLRTTPFGPLLPDSWRYGMPDDGFEYAYMWTAQKYPKESGRLMSAWMDFVASENLDQALSALQNFTAPPMSFAMAFTDGTIGYHTSGIIPVRRSDEPTHLPRDGRFSSANWGEPVPFQYKPTLRNPTRGFFVAANQRIVEEDGPIAHLMGGEGATPHRAKRITERVLEALDDGKASADELLAIQQDIRSVQARNLQPIFAAHCPTNAGEHDSLLVENFCTQIRDFDGSFDKDSLGALPFYYLVVAVQETITRTHLGEDAVRMSGIPFITMSIENALLAEAADETRSVLFDNPSTDAREGGAEMIALATDAAITALVEQAGPHPDNWRYGIHHTLSFGGLLKDVPVVGGLFTTPKQEESGCHTCIRAEGRIPVTFGAGLRLQAIMTDPPSVRMIIDTGNSGHFGNKHLDDQYPLWSEGNPMKLPMSQSEIDAQLEGKIELRR
ncbi:MAG: penicillin acylase family protein [Deltaproteobacteria bacterium]|nr:penicillin acylase family protein [Deltaproteobacteria bacterium]